MKGWILVGGLCSGLVSCRDEKSGMDVNDSGPLATDTQSPDADTDADADADADTDADAGVGPSDPPVVSVPRAGMLSHLVALMDVAEANSGNRAAGSDGYAASTDYVRGQLEAAGYSVSTHDFTISQDTWNSDPQVSAEGLDALTYGSDFLIFGNTASGSVTATLAEVDTMIPPPEGGGATSSGCEAADFDGFVVGQIALIQRGNCTFQTKVSHATTAGASAVLIFNEGQPDRQDLFGGTLDAEVDNTIPAYSMSYEVGTALAALAPDTMVTVVADFGRVDVPTQNLIAETGGDASRSVVVGAHLDSVAAGPGINDNGSGVALILEMAIQMAAAEVDPLNQVRFAFWGGEELGLLGSMDYVFSMEDADRARILANLNFDMVASPNPARMVYDGNGSLGGDAGPAGSIEIEQVFSAWFAAEGMAFQETPFDGRSDYGPFIWTGIPAGGLFTGAEQPKTAEEEDSFGGVAGEAYDACYHQACDGIDNLNLDVLDEMAAAASDAIMRLAMLEGALASAEVPRPVGPSPAKIPPELDWIPSVCSAHDRVWIR
jgi:Zn-dependent M28 family amino/carboxypeptidase